MLTLPAGGREINATKVKADGGLVVVVLAIAEAAGPSLTVWILPP